MFTARRTILATVATVALAGFAALGVAAPAGAATLSTSVKISICKATGSASNPYSFLQTSTDQIVAGHYSADDIVPVFTYVAADGSTMKFLGQNTSSWSVTPDCSIIAPTVAWM